MMDFEDFNILMWYVRDFASRKSLGDFIDKSIYEGYCKHLHITHIGNKISLILCG